MKRREIMCLLAAAGCGVLLLMPLRTRAASLPDLLSIGTINSEMTGTVAASGTAADVKSENTNGDGSVSSDAGTGAVDSSPEGSSDMAGDGTEGALSKDDRAIDRAVGEEVTDQTEKNESDAEAEAGLWKDGEEQSSAEEKGSRLKDILGEGIGAGVILESTKTEQEYAQAYEKAKNANWGYTNLGIANVDNNLNVRAVAAEDGKLVGKLPRNAACEVLDSDDTWAHIKSGKVEGYVSMEFLLTGIPAKRRAEELAVTMARVTTDSLKVRAEANTESEVITLVPNGEELEVADVEGDWVRVYLDDEEVFVSADYVSVSSELNTAITMTELLYGQGVSDVRVDICQYAKEFLGNPYVWGGTSLTKGADCSGFVLSVFKKYGVGLPHSSVAQSNSGTSIKVSEAQPGDLIFYGNGKSINHVAIYIGGGQVIHASSPKTGIRISNVSYRSPVKAVRILQN